MRSTRTTCLRPRRPRPTCSGTTAGGGPAADRRGRRRRPRRGGGPARPGQAKPATAPTRPSAACGWSVPRRARSRRRLPPRTRHPQRQGDRGVHRPRDVPSAGVRLVPRSGDCRRLSADAPARSVPPCVTPHRAPTSAPRGPANHRPPPSSGAVAGRGPSPSPPAQTWRYGCAAASSTARTPRTTPHRHHRTPQRPQAPQGAARFDRPARSRHGHPRGPRRPHPPLQRRTTEARSGPDRG